MAQLTVTTTSGATHVTPDLTGQALCNLKRQLMVTATPTVQLPLNGGGLVTLNWDNIESTAEA